MCRRSLTYLLLSALLLTQWVNANRCMGGCGAVEHDSRPHVHLDAGVPVKADNSGCGCKRQRQAPPVANGTPPTSLAATDGATPTEPTLPDDGVLYLSLDLVLAHRLVMSEGDVPPDPDQLAGLVESRLELNRHRVGRDAFTFPTSPPPASRPLYLLTHSLLI